MSDDASSSREEEPEEQAPESGAGSESGGDGEDDERKPISVRDLMPPSPSEGRRRARDRGERDEERRAPRESEPEEAHEEREEAAEEEEDRPARPTPVRVAMDAPPPGDSRPADVLPSRSFEARGEEWIVRITGRTVTGTRPDPGALLMQLTFYRSEDPEAPVRELLTVDRPLDALYQEDLEEFLDRSRPAKEEFGDGPDDE